MGDIMIRFNFTVRGSLAKSLIRYFKLTGQPAREFGEQAVLMHWMRIVDELKRRQGELNANSGDNGEVATGEAGPPPEGGCAGCTTCGEHGSCDSGGGHPSQLPETGDTEV